MLNSVIAESAWGHINGMSPLLLLSAQSVINQLAGKVTDLNPTGWVAIDNVLHSTRPADDVIPYAESVEDLPRQQYRAAKVMTVVTLLLLLILLISSFDSPDTSIHPQHHFTEPGRPGEGYRHMFTALLTALHLPPGQYDPRVAVFSRGMYHIVPSFFHMVLSLERQHRDFVIVFRTFGDDIPRVILEWNMFCTGTHPLYPHVRLDGSDGTTDRRVHAPNATAKFIRASHKDDGIILSHVAPNAGVVATVRGAAACDQAIQDIVHAGHKTMAIRDDYDYWAQCNEADTAGKLCLVQRAAYGTHITRFCLFFDDNIELTHAHIVDVRNAETGEPIPFTEAYGL